MNYNQLSFWLLFLAVYLLYWRLAHRRQNTLLLVASYLFYGFWDYRFLFLILISTVIDFIGGLGVAGVRLERPRLLRLAAVILVAALLLCTGINYRGVAGAIFGSQASASALFAALSHSLPQSLPHNLAAFRLVALVAAALFLYALCLPRLERAKKRREYFLAISMVANLGILGFFKYCDFFLQSTHDLLTTLGISSGPPVLLGIILPVGISFYTFQAMSYTIDIYRGQCEPTDHFPDFALFVCFFPHLVAGPIMRAHTLLPQVLGPRHRRPGDAEDGLILVIVGLFKKVVLADNMAPIANAVFTRLTGDGGASASLPPMSGLEVLAGIYAFAFQIYGDFSGYSGIARGISKWLGFDLVVNFQLPYLATSPSDFWRRWHISLSTWLRDYLYIPLGGNRGGRFFEYRNLLITMLLGGLWHGARWTFVAWGLYHGAILCLFRLVRIRDVTREAHPGRWLLRVVLMFHLTCAGWLLFRADTFSEVVRAAALIGSDFRLTGPAITALCLIAFHAGMLFVLEGMLDGEARLGRLTRAPFLTQSAVYVYLTLMILFFHARHACEFIYFQF